jgi:hypothetical protein
LPAAITYRPFLTASKLRSQFLIRRNLKPKYRSFK